MTPSCAVITVVTVLVPTARLIGALAAPDVTVTPLTFTVAVASAVVGVSEIEDDALGTLSV